MFVIAHPYVELKLRVNGRVLLFEAAFLQLPSITLGVTTLSLSHTVSPPNTATRFPFLPTGCVGYHKALMSAASTGAASLTKLHSFVTTLQLLAVYL